MLNKGIKVVTLGMLVTALVLPLVACDKKDTTPGKPVPQAAAKVVEEDPDAQLSNKLGAYVDCFNTADGSTRASADRYTSWLADLDAGPTGKERNVNVLGNVSAHDLDTCTKAITQATKAKPSLPALDAAATQYLADLTTLAPLVSQAYAYYSHEDYKDDGFAKAKQMHQPLMMAFGRFILSSDKYGAELGKENDALSAAQIVDIEKNEGRHSAFYHLALIRQAKLLTAQLMAESFDVAEVSKAIAAYGALLDESTKATANEPGKPLSWSLFQSRAEEFLKDGKERMRRVRDKTPYSHGEQLLMKGDGSGGWMVVGSPRRILKSYNELVDAGNRL